jgi:hypothetical protein
MSTKLDAGKSDAASCHLQRAVYEADGFTRPSKAEVSLQFTSGRGEPKLLTRAYATLV